MELLYNDFTNLFSSVEIPMGDIFISYSRTDTDYAHKLAENLQSRGLHIWIDERLDDQAWQAEKLQKRLDSCGAVIIIMTTNSRASERVQSELQHAKQKLKPIFPLWLEGPEPWFSGELVPLYDVRTDQWPQTEFYSALQEIETANPAASAPLTSENAVPLAPLGVAPVVKPNRPILVAAISLLVMALMMGTISFGQAVLRKAMGVFAIALLSEEIVTTAPAALTPESLSDPMLVTRNYEVSLCCGYPGKQRSASLNFLVSVETDGVLKIELSTESDRSACSDIFLHVMWDNKEIYKTGSVGPISGQRNTGRIDLSSLISPGSHTLAISPEGIKGGCNTGALSRWIGKLTVQTSVAPK